LHLISKSDFNQLKCCRCNKLTFQFLEKKGTLPVLLELKVAAATGGAFLGKEESESNY
jgi:hypothetical protein